MTRDRSDARTPCRILMSVAVSARRLHQPLDLRRWHCPTPQSAGGDDCVAGHVRLELRNIAANYPFEKLAQISGNQAEFWPQRLFSFELRRREDAARCPFSKRKCFFSNCGTGAPRLCAGV